MPGPVLAFDIGGTRLRAGIYCPTKRRLERVARRRTPHYGDYPDGDPEAVRRALYAAMGELADELLDGEPARWVSVAFAGPVDRVGNVLAAPTVWGDAGSGPVALVSRLRELWPDARVLLLNDVSAAGFSYLDRSDEDLCIVTVSSGVGHKVFAGGRPLTGPGGRGGEIGHLRVDFSDDAPRCECGYRGHLGALASGRASAWQAGRLSAEDPAAYARSLPAMSGNRAEELSNEQIVDAFRSGDPWTCELIRRLAQPLGRALAGIHLAVGVERFVLIGGFALALGSGYRDAVCDAAAECAWALGAEWPAMVELGRRDDDAGLIGAGRYAARVAAEQ